LATPVAYSLFDDASVWMRRKLWWKPRTPAETGEDEITVVSEGSHVMAHSYEARLKEVSP
jgi:hypothetical protein